jgi:hypothetical protein
MEICAVGLLIVIPISAVIRNILSNWLFHILDF